MFVCTLVCQPQLALPEAVRLPPVRKECSLMRCPDTQLKMGMGPYRCSAPAQYAWPPKLKSSKEERVTKHNLNCVCNMYVHCKVQ